MLDVRTGYDVGSNRIGNKNKDRVKRWFISNPGETIAECSRALGLTWQTVKKHVVAIQKEG